MQQPHTQKIDYSRVKLMFKFLFNFSIKEIAGGWVCVCVCKHSLVALQKISTAITPKSITKPKYND
jgi:hypothetical protein